jgi:hypothetical protein
VVYALSSGAPHEVTFDSAALPFDPAVGRVTFRLVDGEVGDDTTAGDGIVDQGGPGLPIMPAPALSWSGMLAALVALLVAVRRRL